MEDKPLLHRVWATKEQLDEYFGGSQLNDGLETIQDVLECLEWDCRDGLLTVSASIKILYTKLCAMEAMQKEILGRLIDLEET